MKLYFYKLLSILCILLYILDSICLLKCFYRQENMAGIILLFFSIYFILLSYYIYTTSTINIFDYHNGAKLLSFEYYKNIIEKNKLRRFIDVISLIIFLCNFTFTFTFSSLFVKTLFANKNEYYLYIVNFYMYGFLFMWTIYDDIIISILSCDNIMFENDRYISL